MENNLNVENAIPEEKKNDYMWILQNRIFRIFNVITQYGEENFYLSFSGGKDSTVLSALIDMALPNNKIPRVYADTGIEFKKIREFVLKRAETDERIQIIKPTKKIKQMLEEEGYPFKSKKHSQMVAIFQKNRQVKGLATLEHYLHVSDDGINWGSADSCPKSLEYQFTQEFVDGLKISDKCCLRLKEDPLTRWQRENNKPIKIIGLMRAEGGRRKSALCTVFNKKGDLTAFQPLAPVSLEWESWFIDKYNIELCELYYPPYNFDRTGFKGCPFNMELQYALETLSKYLPEERQQCEYIWKPVYDEYRRIGYRLKKEEQLSF